MLLAACAPRPAPESPSSAPTVSSVEVRVAQLDRVRTGPGAPELNREPVEIGADVTEALESALAPDPSGDVTVSVSLRGVELISRVEAAIPGAASRITGVVSAESAETGAEFLAPVEITAGASAVSLPGVAGVVTAPDLEDDYEATVSGFASQVKQRLAAG